MILDGWQEILDCLKARAMSAWNLPVDRVYIGEDQSEKSGAATKYAAIAWEAIEQEHYPAFIEFTCRPLYVVYVGPPPTGKKGAAAKTALSAAFQDLFTPPASIILECVGNRYDEDWDEAKAATVSLVLEYSALWHECRARTVPFSGTGLAISDGSGDGSGGVVEDVELP